MRKPPAIPLATYRLQFNRDLTFSQAADLVPYFAWLGISHCYASLYLRAWVVIWQIGEFVLRAAGEPEEARQVSEERSRPM